jgi:hypothetical protein
MVVLDFYKTLFYILEAPIGNDPDSAARGLAAAPGSDPIRQIENWPKGLDMLCKNLKMGWLLH